MDVADFQPLVLTQLELTIGWENTSPGGLRFDVTLVTKKKKALAVKTCFIPEKKPLFFNMRKSNHLF